MYIYEPFDPTIIQILIPTLTPNQIDILTNHINCKEQELDQYIREARAIYNDLIAAEKASCILGFSRLVTGNEIYYITSLNTLNNLEITEKTKFSNIRDEFRKYNLL